MTISFFQASPDIIKPYALMDLDDTLFQTQRKIDAWNLPASKAENLVCASVNKSEQHGHVRQRTCHNEILMLSEIRIVYRSTPKWGHLTVVPAGRLES